MIASVYSEVHSDGCARLPWCYFCHSELEEGEEAVKFPSSDADGLHKWCHPLCGLDQLLSNKIDIL